MNSSTRSPQQPSLAEHLRSAVAESEESVNQIAQASQVDQSTLNKFLNGDRDNLRLDVADRVFRYLGLRVVGSPRKKTE